MAPASLVGWRTWTRYVFLWIVCSLPDDDPDSLQFQLGGLTVQKQVIGVANKTSGFSGVDGSAAFHYSLFIPSHPADRRYRIFGVGPVGLTRNTVSKTTLVPTVLDNLYKSKNIWYEALGVYFKPLTGNVSVLFITTECRLLLEL